MLKQVLIDMSPTNILLHKNGSSNNDFCCKTIEHKYRMNIFLVFSWWMLLPRSSQCVLIQGYDIFHKLAHHDFVSLVCHCTMIYFCCFHITVWLDIMKKVSEVFDLILAVSFNKRVMDKSQNLYTLRDVSIIFCSKWSIA